MKLFDKISCFKTLNYFGYSLVGDEKGCYKYCRGLHYVYVYYDKDLSGFRWVDNYLNRGGRNELALLVCDSFSFDGGVINELNNLTCIEPDDVEYTYTEKAFVLQLLGCYKVEEDLGIFKDPVFAGNIFTNKSGGYKILLYDENRVVNFIEVGDKSVKTLNDRWGVNYFNKDEVVFDKRVIVSWSPKAFIEYHETFQEGGGLLGYRPVAICGPRGFEFMKGFNELVKRYDNFDVLVEKSLSDMSNVLYFLCEYLNRIQGEISFQLKERANLYSLVISFRDKKKPHDIQNSLNSFYKGFREYLSGLPINLSVVNDGGFTDSFGVKCLIDIKGGYPLGELSFKPSVEACSFLIERIRSYYSDVNWGFNFIFL